MATVGVLAGVGFALLAACPHISLFRGDLVLMCKEGARNREREFDDVDANVVTRKVVLDICHHWAHTEMPQTCLQQYISVGGHERRWGISL